MVQFDPPLSSAVHVLVSSSFLPGSRLRLHATLSRDEHATLRRDGTKVQVWSDFGTGEWSETSFEEEDAGEGVCEDTEAVGDVSLVEKSAEGAAGDTVSLVAATPLLPLVGRTVQFTYRMLHASGSVSWLGSMGTNGSISVETTRDAGLTTEDWREETHGVFSLNSSGGRNPRMVARLDQDADWRGWAIGKEGPSSFTAVSSAVTERVALALLPKARPGAYITYEPVLYHTTGNATLSLTASGEILFYPGEGESALYASTSIQTWRNAISDKATTLDVYSPYFLGISVQNNSNVGCIHVLPLSSTELEGSVTLTSADLNFFASPPDTLALVDSAGRSARFFVPSSLDRFHVAVGPAGGEWFVLSAYTLRNVEGKWNVACLPRENGHVAYVSTDTNHYSLPEVPSSSIEDVTSQSTATMEWFESKGTVEASPGLHPSSVLEAQLVLLMLHMLRFFLRIVSPPIPAPSPLEILKEPVDEQTPNSQVHEITTSESVTVLVLPVPRITFEVDGKFCIILEGEEVSKLALSVDGRPLPAPKHAGEVWLVESDTGGHDGAQLLEVTLHE